MFSLFRRSGSRGKGESVIDIKTNHHPGPDSPFDIRMKVAKLYLKYCVSLKTFSLAVRNARRWSISCLMRALIFCDTNLSLFKIKRSCRR